MTEETPIQSKDLRTTPTADLEALIDEWREDADKIQQTVGVEPTTLIRCAEDLREVVESE